MINTDYDPFRPSGLLVVTKRGFIFHVAMSWSLNRLLH